MGCMKIAVCDDEIQMLGDMAKEIQNLLPHSIVVTFTDGALLMESVRSEEWDLLLLDIDMPGISGLEIAGRLEEGDYRRKTLLVFVTNHDELVYDSLKFHPFGFIRKSRFRDEIGGLLRDCEKELQEKERYFAFKSGTENVKVKLSEILYFESDGNYLRLVTSEREYRLRDTVGAVESALAVQGFIRLHRGFLVNQEAVRVLGAEEAELVSGTKLPIGRSYAESARRRLLECMRK